MITTGFHQTTGARGDHGPRLQAPAPLLLAAPEIPSPDPEPLAEDGACIDDWFGMNAACEDLAGACPRGRC